MNPCISWIWTSWFCYKEFWYCIIKTKGQEVHQNELTKLIASINTQPTKKRRWHKIEGGWKELQFIKQRAKTIWSDEQTLQLIGSPKSMIITLYNICSPKTRTENLFLKVKVVGSQDKSKNICPQCNHDEPTQPSGTQKVSGQVDDHCSSIHKYQVVSMWCNLSKSCKTF